MSEWQPPNRGPSITSASNERIRFVKSLYQTRVRRKERLFLVEGVRLLEEALASGARPELVLIDPEQLERTPRGTALLQALQPFETWTVSEPVLKSLSDTVTPQGAIGLFPIPETPKYPPLGAVALVLDGIRDPGNAGTILRSADASGYVQTVAFVDSVDAYAPKVVRSAMGAHFRLTILDSPRFADVQSLLGDRPVYVADQDGPVTYDKVDWKRDCALILGGEAEGASEAALNAATERVMIPMSGSAESLNAAMAGTIMIFEAARVRREAGESPITHPSRPAIPRERRSRPPIEEEEEETYRPERFRAPRPREFGGPREFGEPREPRRPFREESNFPPGRPYGENESYQPRRPFGHNESNPPRRPFGQNESYPPRRPFEEERPSPPRRPFNEERPYPPRRSFGEERPFPPKRPYGEESPPPRRPFGGKPPFRPNAPEREDTAPGRRPYPPFGERRDQGEHRGGTESGPHRPYKPGGPGKGRPGGRNKPPFGKDRGPRS